MHQPLQFTEEQLLIPHAPGIRLQVEKIRRTGHAFWRITAYLGNDPATGEKAALESDALDPVNRIRNSVLLFDLVNRADELVKARLAEKANGEEEQP